MSQDGTRPSSSTYTSPKDSNATPSRSITIRRSLPSSNDLTQHHGSGISSSSSVRTTRVGALRPKDHFGSIRGVRVGAHWKTRYVSHYSRTICIHCRYAKPFNRKEVSRALVHRLTEAGISWSHEGAYAIVVSGTGPYSQDDDQGNTMYVPSSSTAAHLLA